MKTFLLLTSLKISGPPQVCKFKHLDVAEPGDKATSGDGLCNSVTEAAG